MMSADVPISCCMRHGLSTSVRAAHMLIYCADDQFRPTKGEMAKSIRLLIANARDDEDLFEELGRHW